MPDAIPHEKIQYKRYNRWCMCQSPEKTTKHHVFKYPLRKIWAGLGMRSIKVFFISKTETEVWTGIPIDAYVRICDSCHRLNHPENLLYYKADEKVEHIKQVIRDVIMEVATKQCATPEEATIQTAKLNLLQELSERVK